MRRVTDFARYRAEGEPIALLTCYDAWSARLLAGSDVDAVLVGDSVAMVMHGYESTVHATTAMMALHTAAVRRGIGDRFVIADVPFPLHRMGKKEALRCVDALMKAGASAVKIEGVAGHLEVIEHIVGSGVPVMGHLGLTPQSVHQLGGYRTQGRDAAQARQIEADALALEQAGAFALVLECIPAELAQRITGKLGIPTIGIGSGPHCSGQILVLHDLLGFSGDQQPGFVRPAMDGAGQIRAALRQYVQQVKGPALASVADAEGKG